MCGVSPTFAKICQILCRNLQSRHFCLLPKRSAKASSPQSHLPLEGSLCEKDLLKIRTENTGKHRKSLKLCDIET